MGTEGKYEGTLEEQCRQWIEEVTGESLPWEDAGEGELHNALKSGVALCRLVNKLAPGSIKKISTSKMPFPQRENIQVCARRGGGSERPLLGAPLARMDDDSDLAAC